MGKIKYPKLWSIGKHSNSVKNAFKHHKKHGKKLSDINNTVEYVEKAHSFGLKPPQGTLTKIRPSNGFVTDDEKFQEKLGYLGSIINGTNCQL